MLRVEESYHYSIIFYGVYLIVYLVFRLFSGFVYKNICFWFVTLARNFLAVFVRWKKNAIELNLKQEFNSIEFEKKNQLFVDKFDSLFRIAAIRAFIALLDPPGCSVVLIPETNDVSGLFFRWRLRFPFTGVQNL